MPYNQPSYFVAEPETYSSSYDDEEAVEENNSPETGGFPFPRAATTGAWSQFPQQHHQPGYPNAPQPAYSLPTPMLTASHTPTPYYAPPGPGPRQSQWPPQDPYQYEPNRQPTDRGFDEDVHRLKRKTKESLKTMVSAVQAVVHFSRPRPYQHPPPATGPPHAAGPSASQWLPSPDNGPNFAMPRAQQAPVHPPYHPGQVYQGQAYPMGTLNSQAGPSGYRSY